MSPIRHLSAHGGGGGGHGGGGHEGGHGGGGGWHGGGHGGGRRLCMAAAGMGIMAGMTTDGTITVGITMDTIMEDIQVITAGAYYGGILSLLL